MPSMMRRFTSGAEALGPGRLVHLDQVAGALRPHPVADAVIAGEVGRRLGGSDHVVGGDAVLGVRQRRLGDLAAKSLDRRQRRLEDRPHAGLDPVAPKLARHREAQPAQVLATGRPHPALDPDRGRVARIAALQHGEQQSRIGHVPSQRPALIQRGGEGDHPVAGDRPVRGLQPDDPAESRGLADRTPGIGADRAGRQPPATAAAEPPEDPPGTRSRSQGLRTGPNAEFSFEDPIANSSMLVLPSTEAPASVSRRTAAAV